MNVYVDLATEIGKYRRLPEPGSDQLVAAVKNAVEIGADEKVDVDKMYGPLVAFPIRVYVDFQTVEWVIEREFFKQDEHGDVSDWRVMARFPCQLPSDFEDDA